MRYPTLSELDTSREMLDVFKGYNHNLRIGDGEFYEMTNLSSEHFPALSPRRQRGIISSIESVSALTAKDDLYCVSGKSFVKIDQNGDQTVLDLELSDDGKPKTIVSFGAYAIIFPDKKYINTAKPSDYGSIEAPTVTTSAKIRFTICRKNGKEYEDVHAEGFPPEDPKNLALWCDLSDSGGMCLKQYSSQTETWVTITETYVKLSSEEEEIGKPFSVGDGVVISKIQTGVIADYGGSLNAVIVAKGDKYIVFNAKPIYETDQTTPITIERKIPDMDFVIESGNRLWGCRYFVDQNGKSKNEIYASKLGDFKNWTCFSGISTDSYTVTVGTDGPFTGAISHLGQPIFFKENYMHKVYGNYPSNYQIRTTACKGVQDGCSRSLAVINEVLYYKSRSCICAYDGSVPEDISAALGSVIYGNATAGVLGNKYYISMEDPDGAFHLFVYDTQKGMWHREDDTQASDFCNYRGELYYIDYASNQIKTVNGTGITETTPVKWSATTGIIGTDSPDKKYISRMDIRMKLEVGAKVTFFAEYDSSGDYEYLFTMTGKNLQSFPVPIRPLRCDHMRLRIVGTGEAKIFSICKTIERGSNA